MEKYTIKEILLAAKIGEVSMSDINHVLNLLSEARMWTEKGFCCPLCDHFREVHDNGYCFEILKYINDGDCGGEHFLAKDNDVLNYLGMSS